jgi:hypothetical protein
VILHSHFQGRATVTNVDITVHDYDDDENAKESEKERKEQPQLCVKTFKQPTVCCTSLYAIKRLNYRFRSVHKTIIRFSLHN